MSAGKTVIRSGHVLDTPGELVVFHPYPRWTCVRVVEEHQELTRSFDREWYALAFAEGQRIRLRLDQITLL
jgi:hypothetical protein